MNNFVGATIGRPLAERTFTVFFLYAGGRPMVAPTMFFVK